MDILNNHIENIKKQIEKSLEKKPAQSVSHQKDHGHRVWKRAKHLAKIIMEEENIVIDMKALEIASYLHDIDESYRGKKSDHVSNSMAEADIIMANANIPKTIRQKVLRICSEHSSEVIKESTMPESDLLFDADKLDGLGAIGIARVFALCGQQGLSIMETVNWYTAKIEKVIPYMRTKAGKTIANKKLRYVLSFLDDIGEEEKILEAV